MAEKIRRRKDRPPRDTDEILDDLSRMVVSFGKRAGTGDPTHLAKVRSLRLAVNKAENLAYVGLKGQEQPFDDAEIADALGITTGAVKKRFSRRRLLADGTPRP